jgi:hypothetical protein
MSACEFCSSLCIMLSSHLTQAIYAEYPRMNPVQTSWLKDSDDSEASAAQCLVVLCDGDGNLAAQGTVLSRLSKTNICSRSIFDGGSLLFLA